MLKNLKYIVAPFAEELSALKSWVKITLSFSPSDNLKNARLLESKFSEKFNLPLGLQNPLILIDDFAIPQWLFINSLAAHSLAKEKNASLEVFSFRRLSKHHKIIFNSFDLKKFRVLRLSIPNWLNLYLKYLKIVRQVKSPDDLMNLEVEGIHAGIDIYESILRHGNHTVKLDAMDTARKLFLGIKQIKSFKEIFSNREVIAFFVSHDNYLGPGLAARIAFKYKIPVYLLNSKEILQPSRSFEIYERFSRYREYFDAFEATKKRDLLNKAEIAINSRLDGRVGIDMPYQISSAFENTQTKKQLPPRDNGVRVLIAVHDFFDNPHAYSRMMFRDFWIWLEFLGKVSEETNYLWCIKMHRDFSIPERRAVALFLRKFPKIIYVDPQTSFYQLAEEGITHVLTCHGTVGHELPLLGINVINCAFNPHVAYSFCETYLDIERYRERLSNLSNDDQPKAIGDIKEFYAVHYFHVNKSDFIYPAENSYLDADGALFNFTSALEWPIHNFELVSDRTLTVFQDCIRSGRVFSQESILPDKMQRISLFRNSSNGLRNALDVIYDRTDANG